MGHTYCYNLVNGVQLHIIKNKNFKGVHHGSI